jgi:hypothetical protein
MLLLSNVVAAFRGALVGFVGVVVVTGIRPTG